jgi:hypothetical protein
MYEYEMEQLERLALRARAGDAMAETELRRRLTPGMAHAVRRALRPQSKATPATRRIRAAARDLQTHDPATAADNQRLVRRVSRRIIAMICGERQALDRATSPMQETVRC